VTDRFKLEEAILQADMTNDLKLLFERHCDGPVMTQDEVDNMLMAVWHMSKLRWDMLWDVYLREFELDQYCQDPEVLALRDRVGMKNGIMMEDEEGNRYPMPKGSLKEDVE
jgi:hypothetical protein